MLCGPTCCEKYVPPGRRTRAISSHHVSIGCRLVTSSNAPPANGSAPRSSWVATTNAPRGRSRRAAMTTFGAYPSLATMSAGSRGNAASSSPPPDCTSSIVATVGRPLGDALGVVPARPLLRRATVEPAEVPSLDRRALGFVDQFVERRHTCRSRCRSTGRTPTGAGGAAPDRSRARSCTRSTCR